MMQPPFFDGDVPRPDAGDDSVLFPCRKSTKRAQKGRGSFESPSPLLNPHSLNDQRGGRVPPLVESPRVDVSPAQKKYPAARRRIRLEPFASKVFHEDKYDVDLLRVLQARFWLNQRRLPAFWRQPALKSDPFSILCLECAFQNAHQSDNPCNILLLFWCNYEWILATK